MLNITIGKALPDRVFRQIALGDCSPEVAKRFVVNHLDADAEDGGGREAKPKPSEMREDLIEVCWTSRLDEESIIGY